MTFRIRDAGPADAPAVVRLIHALGEAADYESPLGEEYARAYLAAPGCGVLLAETGGEVAGLLSYSIRPDLFHAADSCLIEELVVREAWRGQGAGSALVRELLRRAAAAGCVEVSVTALADNEGALRFYRAHGLVDEAVYLEAHLG